MWHPWPFVATLCSPLVGEAQTTPLVDVAPSRPASKSNLSSSLSPLSGRGGTENQIARFHCRSSDRQLASRVPHLTARTRMHHFT